MTENSKPSQHPADDNSMRGMMQSVLKKFLQNIDDMLPAKVVSFDRVSNRAVLQPLIKLIKTDGKTISRANLSNIPVYQHSGGGFVINFPLKVGDMGWISANDRDISTFLQNYSESSPNTLRKHSFEDAIFFPDVMRGWEIDPENDDALVIQNLSGSQCISIHDDKIRLQGELLELDFENITSTSPNPITLNGSITATGEIRTLLNGGINLSNHKHENAGGTGNSGGPIA